jgi:hypothetical protein
MMPCAPFSDLSRRLRTFLPAPATYFETATTVPRPVVPENVGFPAEIHGFSTARLSPAAGFFSNGWGSFRKASLPDSAPRARAHALFL